MGGRWSGQFSGGCPAAMRSVPVTTNPHRSRLISSGSHWVQGSAPISTNTAVAGTVSVTPDAWSWIVRLSREHVPVPPVATALRRTAMLGVLVISLIRYSDMLIAVFALAIVVLAGATARLAGWMTLFGAATLMTVSLIEITGYIGTLHTSPATMPETSLALIHSVQHLWFIVGAPALFLPLGLVILGSGVLPRILGYLALVLAAGYALAGLVCRVPM
jgi:hypothetical protein